MLQVELEKKKILTLLIHKFYFFFQTSKLIMNVKLFSLDDIKKKKFFFSSQNFISNLEEIDWYFIEIYSSKGRWEKCL